MTTLGIIDMLKLYGFDAEKTQAKLVRHKDERYPTEELLRNKWLDVYQSYQSKQLFDKVDVIVSFYGLTGTRSCLYGVFKKIRCHLSSEGTILANCPWVHEWRARCPYFYELERLPAYEALERRLVIDWGKGAINWQQHLSNKPVLELLPAGRQLPIFDDYLEFTLSHGELKKLFHNPDAHRDWQSALQAVAGVYLILAETTGHLYVGSAYGAAGVWGRWEQYAKAGGHGGNKLLMDLVVRIQPTLKNSDFPCSKFFRKRSLRLR